MLAEKNMDNPYYSRLFDSESAKMTEMTFKQKHDMINCIEFFVSQRSRLIRFMDNSPATRQLQDDFTKKIALMSFKISFMKIVLEGGVDRNGVFRLTQGEGGWLTQGEDSFDEASSTESSV